METDAISAKVRAEIDLKTGFSNIYNGFAGYSKQLLGQLPSLGRIPFLEGFS